MAANFLDISHVRWLALENSATPTMLENGGPRFQFARLLQPKRAPWKTCSQKLYRRFVSSGSPLRCALVRRLNGIHVDGTSSLERWENGAAPTEAVERDVESAGIPTADAVFLETAEREEAFAEGTEIEASGAPQDKGQALKGIFPGGSRRAEVRLPGLVIMVTGADVVGPGAKEFLDMVDSAIAGGLTMVILDSGSDERGGGARLYEAARILKALLRGRAELLVAERVDIAAAAGASGVLLSDEGLPAVVARSTMQNASAENSVFPLVARSVRSTQSALSATASEGADLLMLQVSEDEDANTLLSSVCEGVSIPIFLQASALSLSSITRAENLVSPAFQAGASGLVFDAIDMKNVAADGVRLLASSLVSAMRTSLQHRSVSGVGSATPEQMPRQVSSSTTENSATSQTTGLDLQAKKILEDERTLLTSLIDLVREASPEMEEVSLLVDAVAQLDEPFLLMIVGEFNSGKSSVINALLGQRYLNEGVLPTTNEITLLKHARNGGDGKERSERHSDGHFIQYISAELLKQMNLVDTPGTNVILKRQQRLTEEFVPRADLVLFVLSADRPFTESEMTFLRYIRQWGKKIIFILNKCDMYSDMKELDEVVNFVKENAQQLLSVEQAIIYPVSARQALKAKREVNSQDGSAYIKKLLESSTWKASGFDELESFIADFLGGSSDAGAERRRLKLETPLGIASALLEACQRQLLTEAEKAESDLDVLDGLLKQLEILQKTMENDATLYHQRTVSLISAVKSRADKFVDSILRVSNIDAVAMYILGGDRKGTMPVSSGFDEQVMGSAHTDVRKLLEEHRSWLKDTLLWQVNSYKEIVRSRWPDLRPMIEDTVLTAGYEPFQLSSIIQKQDSISVLDGFDTQAAKIVLEQELREVVLTTFGGLGAAGVSASVLTSILPTTLEDLIALGICSAGGFIGVWNLPGRRAEVKRKIQQVADSFARQMEVAMETEAKESAERLKEDVGELVRPYHEAARAEASRVSKLLDRIRETSDRLQGLRLRVQNLGIS